jgi:hypothetical protein
VASLKRELVQLKSSVANADVLRREVGVGCMGRAIACSGACRQLAARPAPPPSPLPPPPFPQVHHLNRELLAERTKVKALGEELENPLNVHRWV